jgi:hypothetical protein
MDVAADDRTRRADLIKLLASFPSGEGGPRRHGRRPASRGTGALVRSPQSDDVEASREVLAAYLADEVWIAADDELVAGSG